MDEFRLVVVVFGWSKNLPPLGLQWRNAERGIRFGSVGKFVVGV